ncbi:MAG TPA: hypothetical protein VFA27_15920, partial [Vicinamibacterales bacterium]|nr:hypothetical protein [Vicinamibacterales bacterium]
MTRAVVVAAALASCGAWASAHQTGGLEILIPFPAALHGQHVDGRVLLFVSDDGRTEPRFQTDQYRANTTRPIFGVDVESGWNEDQVVSFEDGVSGWPVRNFGDLPAGDYFVQAMLLRYETFHRGDGVTIKMPMDRGEGQH